MSLESDILIQGYNVRLGMAGVTLTIQDGPGGKGGTVKGLFSVAPPVDPAMDLGSDIREVAHFGVLSPSPANLQIDVRLKDPKTNTTWKIVRREQNPSSITDTFWLVKIIPGVDQ